MNKKIVITGGSGRFGLILKKTHTNYSLLFPNKNILNILDYKNITKYLKKTRYFSHQSATVGLPIGNHANRSHGRTLHCNDRRPFNFQVMVLCGYWELEAVLRDS